MSRTKYADLLALYVNSGNFSILYISILTFYMNCNSTWFLFWTVKLYVTRPKQSCNLMPVGSCLFGLSNSGAKRSTQRYMCFAYQRFTPRASP